jgi:hypothetical protein
MAAQMIVDITDTNPEDLSKRFAGRPDSEFYDPSKLYSVHETNRDFVWPLKMMISFILNILLGFPVSPITMCNNTIIDGGNRTTTIWKFCNNEFEVEINGEKYNHEKMFKNLDLLTKWLTCKIPIVKISNASSQQIAQIFENMNTGVKLSTGQLLENRAYRPIVDAALAIIGRGKIQFPHTELLGRVYKKTFTKTKSRVEVAFAFQLLVGSMYGPAHFNNSFEKHISWIISEDQTYDYTNLHYILTLIDEVDPQNKIPRTKKSYCFKKFAGPMIYDYHTDRAKMRTKWQTMYDKAYNIITDEELKSLFDVKNDRATMETTIQAISQNVEKFLNGTFQADSTDGSINNSEEESE